MGNVIHIDFKNIKAAVPSFLTVLMMVLTYSITKGIGIGVISYVLINAVVYLVDLIKYAASKDKENLVKPKLDISIILIIVFVLFLVYFFVPTEF